MNTRRRAPLAAVALALVAFAVAAFPGAAQAGGNNRVGGKTNGDTHWTTYPTVRHDVDGTTVMFKPDRLPPGGMCVALRNNRTGVAYGRGPCWSAGDHSAKVVASGVPRRTDFRIMARQRKHSWGTSNWSGTMRY